MCGSRKYPYPSWRVHFQFDPHPPGFSVPGGFTVLPPSPGISMTFLLGSPYLLEISYPQITTRLKSSIFIS